jgi:hypothetical protein
MQMEKLKLRAVKDRAVVAVNPDDTPYLVLNGKTHREQVAFSVDRNERAVMILRDANQRALFHVP